MTADVTPAPARTESLARPTVPEVFAHAAEHIARTAAEVWPEQPVRLAGHVPSVTSYVHRVQVGDRTLFAKVSYLGVSLVSLLRGAVGSWPAVLDAQEDYQAQDAGLLAREAAQLLRLAARDRPRVCTLAALRRGVMFTEPVTGPNLAELLLANPADTADLLTRPFTELYVLHRPESSIEGAGLIAERNISGTFLRKFNGLTGTVYLDRLGAERCKPEERQEVIGLLRAAVPRLHRLRAALPPEVHPGLAYGDLKPEHVHFPDGPDERPVLLDPALLQAGPTVDVAKLLSRTLLTVSAARPGPAAADEIAAGFGGFAAGQLLRMSQHAQRLWLRHVLTLWLMDTANILTTYLSAPAGLPLPVHALGLIERAGRLSAMLDAVSTDLSTSMDIRQVWDRMMNQTRSLAS